MGKPTGDKSYRHGASFNRREASWLRTPDREAFATNNSSLLASLVKNETIREHFGAKRQNALSENRENISGAFLGRLDAIDIIRARLAWRLFQLDSPAPSKHRLIRPDNFSEKQKIEIDRVGWLIPLSFASWIYYFSFSFSSHGCTASSTFLRTFQRTYPDITHAIRESLTLSSRVHFAEIYEHRAIIAGSKAKHLERFLLTIFCSLLTKWKSDLEMGKRTFSLSLSVSLFPESGVLISRCLLGVRRQIFLHRRIALFKYWSQKLLLAVGAIRLVT